MRFAGHVNPMYQGNPQPDGRAVMCPTFQRVDRPDREAAVRPGREPPPPEGGKRRLWEAKDATPTDRDCSSVTTQQHQCLEFRNRHRACQPTSARCARVTASARPLRPSGSCGTRGSGPSAAPLAVDSQRLEGDALGSIAVVGGRGAATRSFVSTAADRNSPSVDRKRCPRRGARGRSPHTKERRRTRRRDLDR